MTLRSALSAESALLETRYRLALETMAREIADTLEKGSVSTHLGHNLGNRCAELSAIAGSYESVTRMRAYVTRFPDIADGEFEDSGARR